MSAKTDWRRTRKIARLPRVSQSPQTILASSLEKAGHMANVVLVIQWQDGTWDTDWSTAKASELAFAGLALTHEATRIAFGESDPDDVESLP